MINEIDKLLEDKVKGDELVVCKKLLKAIDRKMKMRGRAKTWAAAIYYTCCRIILNERTRNDVEELFNVRVGTFTAKYTDIKRVLALIPFDKRFLPRQMYEKSPMGKMEKHFRDVAMIKEWSREILPEDFTKTIDNVMSFINKKFPGLIEKAVREFKGRYNIKEWTNPYVGEFHAQFLLDDGLPNGYTPIEFYFDEEEDKEIVDHRVVTRLMKYRVGTFEIIERRGRWYKLKDIIGEDTLDIKTTDMGKMDPGTVIKSRIIPLNKDYWIFYGGVSIYGPDQGNALRDELLSKAKRLREYNEQLRKDFIKFFNSQDVEFEGIDGANKTIREFNTWMTNKKPDELEEFKGLNERFRKYDRIGLVYTNSGLYVVPYYGDIKDILSGNYSDIEDWETLLREVVKRDAYIPDTVLKWLLYQKRDTAVRAFNKVYPGVKTFDGLMGFVEYWRPNIHAKELPSIKENTHEDKGYKVGRNDPCPCGSGKKYKKCCWLKDKEGG